MPIYRWLAMVAMASLPLAANAQQNQTNIQPADPTAAQAQVPVVAYQSSFKDYKAIADDSMSPDAIWVKVNQEVAGQEGYATHAAHDIQPAASAPKQATPPADSHAGHHMPYGEGH